MSDISDVFIHAAFWVVINICFMQTNFSNTDIQMRFAGKDLIYKLTFGPLTFGLDMKVYHYKFI